MSISIKTPWVRPYLCDCAEIIEWLRERLGKHPLAKRMIFPLALVEDSSRAIIEAEDGEEFYAVVDFYQIKGGWKVRVVMLPDRASVQRQIDDTHVA